MGNSIIQNPQQQQQQPPRPPQQQQYQHQQPPRPPQQQAQHQSPVQNYSNTANGGGGNAQYANTTEFING